MISLAAIALTLSTLSPIGAYDLYVAAQCAVSFRAASFDRMVSDECRARGLDASNADDRAVVAVALAVESRGTEAAWLAVTSAMLEAA